MPLTPHGAPGGPFGGLDPRAGLLAGGLILAVGLALGLSAPLQGLAVGGFGLALVAWSQLMRDDAGSALPPKFWLALGCLAGLASFVSAFLLLR